MEKNIVISALVLLLAVACSDEKKFEIISTDAYAFSLQPGWELNASATVAGFIQKESDEDGFYSKLSYAIHLVTPQKDTLFEADYGYFDKHEPEEIQDVQIESQIEIDSSFATGTYTVIFEVTDDYSHKTISANKTFEIEEE